jgi:hypothetical protein
MFLKRRFARWLTRIRVFLLHPIFFNGVKLVYFIGLIALLILTNLSPSLSSMANMIHEINLSKTINKKNVQNPIKSEIHILNSFYLNTEQSKIDQMNPVSLANLNTFVDFFIEKNEFLKKKEFNFYVSFGIKFFENHVKKSSIFLSY